MEFIQGIWGAGCFPICDMTSSHWALWIIISTFIAFISIPIFQHVSVVATFQSLLIAASNLFYNQIIKYIDLWAKYEWRGSAEHLRDSFVGKVHALEHLDFVNIILLLRGLFFVAYQFLSSVSHEWKSLPRKWLLRNAR